MKVIKLVGTRADGSTFCDESLVYYCFPLDVLFRTFKRIHLIYEYQGEVLGVDITPDRVEQNTDSLKTWHLNYVGKGKNVDPHQKTKGSYHELSYLNYNVKPKSAPYGYRDRTTLDEVFAGDYDLLIQHELHDQDLSHLSTHGLGVINGMLHPILYMGFEAYVMGGGKTYRMQEVSNVGILSFGHNIKTRPIAIDPNKSSHDRLIWSPGTEIKDKYPLFVLNGKITPSKRLHDGTYAIPLPTTTARDITTLHEWYYGEELGFYGRTYLQHITSLNNWIDLLRHPINFVILSDEPISINMISLNDNQNMRWTTLQEPTFVLFDQHGYITHYHKLFLRDHWVVKPILH